MPFQETPVPLHHGGFRSGILEKSWLEAYRSLQAFILFRLDMMDKLLGTQQKRDKAAALSLRLIEFPKSQICLVTCQQALDIRADNDGDIARNEQAVAAGLDAFCG